MGKEPIYVIGYPRSGNTWLSRILGDALNSPVGGLKNARPLATEGQERPGAFMVYQLHLKPVQHDVEGGISGNELNIYNYGGGRIVHIIRDPRDVAVSIKYYWNLPDIKTSIETMANGIWPLEGVGKWVDFVQNWEKSGVMVAWTRYENIFSLGSLEIMHILKEIGLERVKKVDVEGALTRQEIINKRNQIERDGDGRPYGKETQLKHLRKGTIGDWKNEFTKRDCVIAQEYFGDMMARWGYTVHSLWWKEANLKCE